MELKEMMHYEYNGNEKMFQKKLRSIKQLSKIEDKNVSIEVLEKVLLILMRKYDMKAQWLNVNEMEKIIWYSWSLMRKTNHDLIGTVHDKSVYGVYVKMVLMACEFVEKERGKRK